MITDYPPLAGRALDRDAETRADPERLRAAWRDPAARLLRLRGAEVPVVENPVENRVVENAGDENAGGENRVVENPGDEATRDDAPAAAPRLALIPTDDDFEPGGQGRPARHVYLGRAEGAPVFAVSVTRPADEAAADPSGDPPGERGEPDERWRHPFEIADRLPEVEREMLAVASGLIRWHESAVYSPRDGSLTEPDLGGWMRRDAHGGEHFPRTDPAVIVLVEHEDRVLLGSNALWETGRFSLLAGFVETGESLEQAVAREVFEESGARLEGIEYVTSQPWPFPRSLMLGFRARLACGADPEALSPDPEEISELRWFTREELRHPAPGLTLPMPLSIARWMIDRWVVEGDRGTAAEERAAERPAADRPAADRAADRAAGRAAASDPDDTAAALAEGAHGE